jgi:hypothetical protein
MARKYKEINLDKFNKINDKDLAYVLGYLAWAGHRNKELDTLVLTVGGSGREYLEKIVRILKIQNKIRHDWTVPDQDKPNAYIRYTISISQKGIAKAFQSWYYGEVDAKKFPPKMPKQFLPYYLRGYYERHGSVSKRDLRTLNMSGPSISFVEDFKEILEMNGMACKVVVNTYKSAQKDTYRIRIHSLNLIQFFNFIYKGNYNKGTTRKNDLMQAVAYWKERAKSSWWRNRIERGYVAGER